MDVGGTVVRHRGKIALGWVLALVALVPAARQLERPTGCIRPHPGQRVDGRREDAHGELRVSFRDQRAARGGRGSRSFDRGGQRGAARDRRRRAGGARRRPDLLVPGPARPLLRGEGRRDVRGGRARPRRGAAPTGCCFPSARRALPASPLAFGRATPRSRCATPARWRSTSTSGG